MTHSIEPEDELKILNPRKTKIEAIEYLFEKFDDKSKKTKYAIYDTIEYILNQDNKVNIDDINERMLDNLKKYGK